MENKQILGIIGKKSSLCLVCKHNILQECIKIATKSRYILCIIVVLFLHGCTVYKRDFISYLVNYTDQFVSKMENNDPFYFYCFDQEHDISKNILSKVTVSCIKGWDWNLDSRVSITEQNEYKQIVNYCTISRYIEKNYLNLKKEMVVEDKGCFTLVYLYVVSNEKSPDNKDIFNTFYDSIIKYYLTKKPEFFFCFNKNKDELYNDIVTILDDRLKSLRNVYYQKLPADTYGKIQDDYNKMMRDLLKKY